jgi:hypothetical protein
MLNSSLNRENSRLCRKVSRDSTRSCIYVRDIINSIVEQIKLLKEIENIKISLAMQTDFTLMNVFRLFEQQGKIYCNSQDIQRCFNSLRLFPTALFLKRFVGLLTNFSSNELPFSDFTFLFLPISPYYSQLLRNRANTSKPFSPETVSLLQALLHKHLDLYRFISVLYTSIDRDSTAIRNCFNIFDIDNKGCIGEYEVMYI